jgi:2-methylisocitrate lyase-like PEP mutase family enzyme
MGLSFGKQFKQDMSNFGIVPLIGVYDVFSASIAAKYYNGIFVSGFGFAASYYGLPDIGFIAWSDMVCFVQRIRTILPNHHIIVDMDDGYGDPEIASHVTTLLASSGASGIVLEDQKRPRKCGHFDGKELLALDDYLRKLEQVLKNSREMFVVARTDATDSEDIFRRAKAFAGAGADAILIDAVHDLSVVKDLKNAVSKPLVFNQIAGGKSPVYTLEELEGRGVSIVIYSTPCLFPAQAAVEDAMVFLKENGGIVPTNGSEQVDLNACVDLLKTNQNRRGTIEPGSSL